MRNEMEGNCFAPNGDCVTPSLDQELLTGDKVLDRFHFELSIATCLFALLGLLLVFMSIAIALLHLQVGSGVCL